MRNVLITGCSTGIGEACAIDLAQRSIRVFAGVRKPDDAQRLRDKFPGVIEPIMIEVTDEQSVRNAAAEVSQALQRSGASGLDGLVNNAGIIVPGPWELISTDQLRHQYEVNVFGTHRVTRHFLPLLRPVRGRVVLIGSISGVVTPPFMGAYASSKHALESFADGLRVELEPWKMSVSLIEPDSVSTPIWDKMVADATGNGEALDAEARQVYVEQLDKVRTAARAMGDSGMPVVRVVRAVRHALLSRWPGTRYPVGFRTRLAIWAYFNLPNRWFDWFMARAMGLR